MRVKINTSEWESEMKRKPESRRVGNWLFAGTINGATQLKRIRSTTWDDASFMAQELFDAGTTAFLVH